MTMPKAQLYAMLFLNIISYIDLVKCTYDFSLSYEIWYFTIVLFLNLSNFCKDIINKVLYIGTSSLVTGKAHIHSGLNTVEDGEQFDSLIQALPQNIC